MVRLLLPNKEGTAGRGVLRGPNGDPRSKLFTDPWTIMTENSATGTVWSKISFQSAGYEVVA